MGSVLRIDHKGDLTNHYVQVFRSKFVFNNFHANYSIHSQRDAIDADANGQYVATLLTNNHFDYISGAGHGDYELFMGGDGIPIWSAGQNLNFLRGKIIHLLSCQTGAVLGRAMI